MKKCGKCKKEKNENEFTPTELKINTGRCKTCVSATNKKWRKENHEKQLSAAKEWNRKNPERHKANTKKWAQENPEKKRLAYKKWVKNNSEKVSIRKMEWARANPEKVKKSTNAAYLKKYQNDPAFRLRKAASKATNQMIRSQGGSKNGYSVSKFLPWKSEELWKHLLQCMKQPGNEWMTIDNQGAYDPDTWDNNDTKTWTWQLDHIIPQSDLPYDTMEHPNFKKCWDLSNLRPLAAKQNLMDGISRTRHQKKDEFS
jgi:hypothetical protein